MNWSWQDEAEPPEPQGMIGVGAVARRLFAALERAMPTAAMMATANDDVLMLTGMARSLPWVDGAQYVAPRAEAAALWLPTTRRPAIALDLLEAAIRRRHQQQPLLLLEQPARLFPLTRLLPVDAGLLQQIRARWQYG